MSEEETLREIIECLRELGVTPNIYGEIWVGGYHCPCCAETVAVVDKIVTSKGINHRLRYGVCKQGAVMIRSFYPQ